MVPDFSSFIIPACIAGVALTVGWRFGRRRDRRAAGIGAERFGGEIADCGLEPLELEAAKLGSETPADFAWNQLLSFDACVECGRCEGACPAHAAGQPLNPKKLIQVLAAALPVGKSDVTYPD